MLLYAAASPFRPGCVSVAGELLPFATEPGSACERQQCSDAIQAAGGAAGASPTAVPAAVAPWSCAVQERIGLCLQKDVVSSCTLLTSVGCVGSKAAPCSWDIDSGLEGAS